MLSVIIPIFNRPRQLRLAVDSVLKQRGLGATKLEIIVVDDGSTLSVSHEELAGWHFGGDPVKIIKLAKNSGPAAARNAGILAANGEFIALLDSDDLWLPDKIAHQLELLIQATKARPDRLHAVVCGFYYKRAKAAQLHGRIPIPASTLRDFVSGCWFSPGSTLVMPRYNFLQIGLFDERLRALEDLDWFIRFGQFGGQLHVAPEVDAIVLRRLEPRNK